MSVEIFKYIALVVEEELDHDMLKKWYKCVKSNAPRGTMISVEVSGNRDSAVSLIKRTIDKDIYYTIPLSRDLLEVEASRIVAVFSNEFDDDFDIEATISNIGNATDVPVINIDREKYVDLCTSLSKKQHNDWVKTRTEDGWRYGQDVSIADKTHPLLRAWDELPDQFKQVDFAHPQKLIDLLDDHGYAVVSKPELDATLKIVRKLTNRQ